MERLTKILKDLGDGIFDTFIKAPYAFGDYLARLSGFRDYQHGAMGYYKEQAVNEFRIINKVLSNNALRNEAWNIFINDFINRPAYYIGSRTVMSSFLKTIPSRIVQAEYLAFIAVAKVDNVAHEVVEKNKELYDYVNSILKYSERDEALNSDKYLDDMYKMTKNQLKKSYDFKVHIDFDNYIYWAGGENVLEATQNIISYHDQNNVWKVELIGNEEDNNLVIKSNSATKEDLENLIKSLSMDPTDTYEKAIKEIEKEISNDLNKKCENDLLMEDILDYDVIGSKEIYPVENINKESMNEILGEFLRGYESISLLSLDHKEEAFVA